MSMQNIRFSGPSLLTNAAVTRYTVPAASQAVIKHIHVSNPTVNAVTFSMSIGAAAAGTDLYNAFSIAAGDVLDVFCMYVLNAGEIVQAFAGTDSVLTFTIDGSLFTIP